MQQLSDILADDGCPADAALCIARDAHPNLCIGRYQAQLDVMARPIAEHLRPRASDLEQAVVLMRHVYGQLQFTGDDAYDDPRNNYLHHVLERRRGTPVALATVLIALGRRAGLEVEGIGFPGHFMARVQGIYVDPFSGNYPIDPIKLLALARETTSSREAAMHMEPVGIRTMSVRLLLNLRRIYQQRHNHARAMVVADRLYELTHMPFHRADRGAHALALGSPHIAITDFKAYLDAHPNAPDADRVRTLLQHANQMTAPFN